MTLLLELTIELPVAKYNTKFLLQFIKCLQASHWYVVDKHVCQEVQDHTVQCHILILLNRAQISNVQISVTAFLMWERRLHPASHFNKAVVKTLQNCSNRLTTPNNAL